MAHSGNSKQWITAERYSARVERDKGVNGVSLTKGHTETGVHPAEDRKSHKSRTRSPLLWDRCSSSGPKYTGQIFRALRVLSAQIPPNIPKRPWILWVPFSPSHPLQATFILASRWFESRIISTAPVYTPAWPLTARESRRGLQTL